MRRAALGSLLLLFAVLGVTSLPAADGSLATKRVVLNVRLDPPWQAFYTSAKILLHNQGPQSIDILELVFPAPLGCHTKTTAVWDEKGELAWRSDPVEESDDRTLLVSLRSRLKRGDEILLGLNFETTLEQFSATNSPAMVSAQSAHLDATGWYPLPVGSGAGPPRTLRLVVRLSKDWQVSSPVKLHKFAEHTLLASYELNLKQVEAGQTIFRAWAPDSTGPP